MFSSGAPARPALAFSLSIVVPKKPVLEQVLTAIANRNEYLDLGFAQMTSSDVARLVQAFSAVEERSAIKTLVLTSVFTMANDNRYHDLVKIWEAVKYKIEKIKLDQNNIPRRFHEYIQQQLKTDPKIRARDIDFSHCDRAVSATPSASPAKSPQPSPVKSPLPNVSGSFFAASSQGPASKAEASAPSTKLTKAFPLPQSGRQMSDCGSARSLLPSLKIWAPQGSPLQLPTPPSLNSGRNASWPQQPRPMMGLTPRK